MSSPVESASRRWPTVGQAAAYVLGLAALGFFLWSLPQAGGGGATSPPTPATTAVSSCSSTPVECRCRCVIEVPDPAPHRPAEGEEDL